MLMGGRIGGVVLALAGFLALSGCGQDKEPEATVRVEPAVMVPAAAPDTTAPVAATETIIEPETPAASEPVAAVTSPFHRPAIAAATGGFDLQLGSFRRESNVRVLQDQLRALGHNPEVEVASLAEQTYHRVLIRGLQSREEATRLGEDLHAQLGLTYLIRQQ